MVISNQSQQIRFDMYDASNLTSEEREQLDQ